jgi:transposase
MTRKLAPGDVDWNPERVALLRSVIDAGATFREAAARLGVSLGAVSGKVRKLYGTRYPGGTKNPTTQATRDAIAALLRDGVNIVSIAQRLSVSRTAVYKVVQETGIRAVRGKRERSTMKPMTIRKARKPWLHEPHDVTPVADTDPALFPDALEYVGFAADQCTWLHTNRRPWLHCHKPAHKRNMCREHFAIAFIPRQN